MLTTHQASRIEGFHPTADHEQSVQRAHLRYPKNHPTRASDQGPFETERSSGDSARCREAQDPHLRGQYQWHAWQHLWRARSEAARSCQESDRSASMLGLDQQQKRPALQGQPRIIQITVRGLLRVHSLGADEQYLSAAPGAPQLDREQGHLAGEAPIPQLKKLEAGIVLFGHNWNDEQVLETQKQNFQWFGWKTPHALSFNWQCTKDAGEESLESYLGAIEEFDALMKLKFPG